jgi:peptidoglycan/LPS O-acetylase OafA/YrhL
MGFELGKLRGLNLGEYLIRFVFGAGISLVAGVVTLIFGARVGGLFLAFPAILPATLTLVEDKEGTRRADKNAGGAVLGAVALVVFAIIAYLLLTTSAPSALGLALLGWCVAALLLYLVGCHLRPGSCSDDS